MCFGWFWSWMGCEGCIEGFVFLCLYVFCWMFFGGCCIVLFRGFCGLCFVIKEMEWGEILSWVWWCLLVFRVWVFFLWVVFWLCWLFFWIYLKFGFRFWKMRVGSVLFWDICWKCLFLKVDGWFFIVVLVFGGLVCLCLLLLWLLFMNFLSVCLLSLRCEVVVLLLFIYFFIRYV